MYKHFFRQKLLQITIRNFWCKNVFDRPTGVASALKAQFGFLVKSALKMRCTKFLTRQKLLQINIRNFCYVTFFDILHHYGVIAGSQICSVSRKYCAVLRNRFFTFSTIRSIKYCIGPKNWSRDFDESPRFEACWFQKKLIFVMSSVCLSVSQLVGRSVGRSVCLSVCLSVDTITQKVIELAQPSLVCDLIWQKSRSVLHMSKIGPWVWPLPWEHNSVFGRKVP